ncbi:MAG: hypothetical protein MJZ99_01415 [Bacteroidales bacterium]|nr:hypothetical protein [Bacteroidales bacterium]
MKIYKWFILFVAACALSASCTSPKIIVTTSDLESTNNEIELKLKEKGYVVSNKSTDTKNEIYVSGQSYSKYTGYSTEMDNHYQKYDTYSFVNEQGNKISYTIKYTPAQTSNYDTVLYYADNLSMVGCEVTEPGKYSEICGDQGMVRNIFNDTQTRTIEVYDEAKIDKAVSTATFVVLIATLIGCSLVLVTL